ncbi:MAG: hypothetical protein GY926_24665 [bacterium]|nr:hypothetical protein [bacterium]
MRLLRTASRSRLAALALLPALAMAACSGGDSTATTGPPESMSLADLDATIRPAAQTLLDAPDVEATTIYFAFDDAERVYRYDWMAARNDGDHIIVSNDIDQDAIAAFVQSGADRYSASEIGDESQPWAIFSPALEPPEGTLPLALVSQMADGSVLALDDGLDQIAVTRQEAQDGSMMWSLTSPAETGDTDVLTAEWIIDSDGTLWFYRTEADETPLAGYARTIVTRFSIPEEPAPIGPPIEGTGLDLESLGVPDNLIALDE